MQSAYLLLFVILLTLSACEKEAEIPPPMPETSIDTTPGNTGLNPREIPGTSGPQTQFNIDNKSYLFDVSDHTIEELESLLVRAHEISELNMGDYPDLEIVMILHGPDIDWFARKNYERNRKLVDLAAKLDAFDIIDMKVCEKTLDKRGVDRDDIPAFIESVPYAPDEIRRLEEAGFITM